MKITLALFWFIIALPLNAQPTQAQYDSLKARVAALEQVLGTSFLGKTSGQLQLELKPANELPGGKYPYILSDYQLRTSGLGGLQSQVSGVTARLAAVEAAVAGGYQVGTAVFDKVRANKICVGDADCDGDWNADIQVRKNYSAVIGLEANLAKVDPQDAMHTHVSQVSVSQDGGLRWQQNAQSTFSRGFVANVNPCRAWLNFGPDSRANISIYRGAVNEETCSRIPHDNAQDLVFLPEESAKEFKLFLPRPLWNIRIVGSSTVNAADLTLQPKQ